MSLVMSSEMCPSGTRAVEVEGAGPPSAMVVKYYQIVPENETFLWALGISIILL